MKSNIFRVALAAAAWLGAASCSSDATAPAPAVPAAGPSASLVGDLLVSVLQRSSPLSQDYSATATIGTAGGTIRIPQAGFSITFPQGAVGEPVSIRATALAGRNVAYRFEPHGLVFLKEPVIRQELGLTEALSRLLLGDLAGGYVPDESQLGAGAATVTETRPAQLDLLGLRMSFSIRHFSAYVASSGRRTGYISSSGNRSPTASPALSSPEPR
jgi:hypothetical protein